MFSLKPLFILRTQGKQYVLHNRRNNVQVTVVGGATEIGSNLAAMLRPNPKITRLHLYDDDNRVTGVGLELESIPGPSEVCTFSGNCRLPAAIADSDLIVMVARSRRRHDTRRQDNMLSINAPAVERLCRAMAKHNPDAFLAISTNPINSMVPLACYLLTKYLCFNQFKVFGITHIDTARARTFAGNLLKVDPQQLNVPVIGGHSEDTIIPLYSNMTPNNYKVNDNEAYMLTNLVKRAGAQIIKAKQGADSSTLAVSWSINEFLEGMIDAIIGYEVVLNCFTANPHFKSRYYSGPTTFGENGIIKVCQELPNLSELEKSLLKSSVPRINKDVLYGEELARSMHERIL